MLKNLVSEQEKCCDTVSRQQSCEEVLRRMARDMRDEASRLEKLADQVDRVSGEANQALFNLIINVVNSRR